MAANAHVNGNIVYEQSVVIKKAIRTLKNLSSDEEFRKIEINSVFDTLNALEYSVNFIEEKDSDELLQICMNILSSANEHLLSKWCHLVTNLITRQQVVMQRNNVKILMEYVVNKISVSGMWSLPDLLSVLSVLLQSGGSEMEMFWERLVGDDGILWKFSLSNYPDRDVHHITLKCLENLLAKKQNEAYPHEKMLLNCFSTLLMCLKAGTSVATDNISNCKLIVTTLKALQNLLLGWKTIPIGQLGILLSVLKFYLFHGQPGQGSFSPVSLYPAINSQFNSQQIADQSSFPKLVPQKRRNRRKSKGGRKGNAGKKDKEEEDSLSEGNSSDTGYSSQQRYKDVQQCSDWKPNLTPPWLTSSSDSEYSDSEGNQVLKLRAVQSLVRQHAFSALQAVIRITDKKSMFGYWLSFLPDSPSNTISQSQTILVTILKDPSPQVRAAAISVLTDLLTGSKQFLMMADESVTVRTAFIPLSATLGSLVRELHRCLLLCLIAENSSFILIQLLKCYAVLVNNIPYHRFHPDLLIRLIKHLRPLLHHKDSQVQVACLSVIGSIVCVQPVPKEVIVILEDLNNKLDELDNAMLKLSCERLQIGKEESLNEPKCLESGKEVPWLVKLCHENILADDKVPLPVQLESLQVLALFAKAYFNVVRKHLCIFEDLIMNCLQHKNSFLQLHGSKLLEATGSSINNDIKTCHGSEDVSSKGSCLSLDKATEFWQKLLMGPLSQCLQNENHPTLRAICCNCLSTLTSEILDSLPKTLNILCLTLMLGLGGDRDPNVKGAAIRCLGIYVLFPCLGENSSFILNAGDVIMEAVKDEHFGVRAKASWSLGNLSNALLSNRDDWPDFSLDVPDVFLYSVGEAAIFASKDHDNVRANAVRTLGNLLHYLPENLLYKERMKIMIAESISALLLNLKTRFVKVRWNSCYALGKVLQNLSLLKSSLLPMDQIITALLAALNEGSNFKVCINAAISLSSVTQRQLYGVHFFDIWKQMIFSLSNTYTDVDFKELRHKDNFCNQLCISLCHLASLLQIDDLSHIYEITLCSIETLIPSMKKLSQVDNSDEKLKKATIHIDELMQSSELNNEQKIVLDSLKEVICSALP